MLCWDGARLPVGEGPGAGVGACVPGTPGHPHLHPPRCHLSFSTRPPQKRGGWVEGTALANPPEFHGNRKFSPLERKLRRRIGERRDAHFELSISGFPARPSPPFTPPSLPSPEARAPHLHGQGSLKAPRAQRSPPGAGEDWAGLGCSIPAHPLAASAPAPSGAAGREAKGASFCSGKASPPENAGSIAAVAMSKPPQGHVGLRGGSGALRWGRV